MLNDKELKRKRKYRRIRKATMRCHDCGKPSGIFTFCEKCRKKFKGRAEEHKQRREKYKKEGRCPRCSAILHPEMDEGRKACLNCRERKRIKPF